MKMNKINLVIEISDLFEVYDGESTIIDFIDKQILPLVKFNITESDIVGIGDRFSQLLDRIKTTLDQAGSDRFRNLTSMLKLSLKKYISDTGDIVTGRKIFNQSMHKGMDITLVVTAAVILANALSKQHPEQSMGLIKSIAGKLSGAQDDTSISDSVNSMIGENTSVAATGSASIAVVPTGKKIIKKRKDSIFAEGDVIPFPSTSTKSGRPSNTSGGAEVVPFTSLAKHMSNNGDTSMTYNTQGIHPNDVFSVSTWYYNYDTRKSSEQQRRKLNILDILGIMKTNNIEANDGEDLWQTDDEKPLVFYIMVKTLYGSYISRDQIEEINQAINNNYEFRIMAENFQLSFADIDYENIPQLSLMNSINSIKNTGKSALVEGIIIDSSTAELILAVYDSLNHENKHKFCNRSIIEMMKISKRLVESGFIQVVMEEV
jgi:hypothetical protein